MNKFIVLINKNYFHFILLLIISIVFSSCKTYSDEDHSTFDLKIKNYLSKSKQKDFEKSESGLYFKIIKEGNGEFIKLTDEVTFNYVGKLLNGKIFDGEHKKNPITFQMKDLIQGWKEGMLYLKPGGKMKMIVPPYLGYGDYELDNIPPHSILFFDIEVIDVK
jgi:FKBP-type peptidyl-prolyl cis-trans isomerase FkpA